MDNQTNGIVSNWNSVVQPDDEVYIIGDLAFMTPNQLVPILQRLNGRKFLIKGNHDAVDSPEVESEFEFIKDFHEMNVDVSHLGGLTKQKIVMCHYALRVWNKSHHGSWNLFGHSHGSLAPIGKQLDVSIDATLNLHKWFGSNFGVKPFTPISLDQVSAMMDSINQHKVDHH